MVRVHEAHCHRLCQPCSKGEHTATYPYTHMSLQPLKVWAGTSRPWSARSGHYSGAMRQDGTSVLGDPVGNEARILG